MKKWFKRLRRAVRRNPQYKIIFLGVPCMGLLALAFFTVLGRVRLPETEPVAPSSEVTESAAPAESTPRPVNYTPSGEDQVECRINAHSSELDMYVWVSDLNGDSFGNAVFSVSVEYPNGEKSSFVTDKNGECYISELEPGDYRVSVDVREGFSPANTVICTVKGKSEYKVIEHISEQTEVVSSSEINEPTVAAEETPTVFAEEVRPVETPEEIDLIEVNVLDENGNQTYKYTYSVGENGCLLTASGEESDVFPIEENGVLAYGLRKVIRVFYADGTVGDVLPDETVPPESYTLEESSEEVALFNEDNTPVADYAITAVPIVELQSVTTGWMTVEGKVYYYGRNGKPVKGLKSIDGKIYYFDADGVRAKSVGVDVSSFNLDINWGMVKSAGIDFAIIRVGGRSWYNPGKLYDDDKFADNIRQARAAGVKVGVYFYSMAVNTNEAVEEASLVVERLGGSYLEMPIFIDVENSGIAPNARADGVAKDVRTEIVNAFCTTIENAGYAAGFYSGQSFMTHRLDMNALSKYFTWMASYTGTGFKPQSFAWRYDMWQMTDSGFVPGINGCVDINILW